MGKGPFYDHTCMTAKMWQEFGIGTLKKLKLIKQCLKQNSTNTVYWINLKHILQIEDFLGEKDVATRQLNLRTGEINWAAAPALAIRFEINADEPYGRCFWYYCVRRLTEKGRMLRGMH